MSVDLPTIAPDTVVPEPITISTDYSRADRFYRRGVWAVSMGVLVLLFLIGLFLFKSGFPAFQEAGWRLLHPVGLPDRRKAPGLRRPGLAGRHPRGRRGGHAGGHAGGHRHGALPQRVRAALGRRPLISMIDLAAAIPSIIFGLWAVFELETNVVGFSTWLSRHLAFIPFFKVNSPPLNASLFIAGLVVGLMIVPIVASISREVFSLAPPGEREAALALGASRWQMIRTVVLPFGRGGMIGAVMLGLGRALEETIAVSIILGTAFRVSPMILQHGGSTISQLIAVNFGSGGTLGLQDLLLCGFVLFAITLVVNLIASAIINRSRSGAGVDL